VTNISVGHTSDSFQNLWTVDDDPKQGFRFAKEIHKPQGMIDEIVDWCKAELIGEWRWQIVNIANPYAPGRYIFYFDSDRDQCAFVLKWA
jgi:hypothetical protein